MHKKAKNVIFSKFLACMLAAVLLASAIPVNAGASDIYGAGQVNITSGTLNVRSAASAYSSVTASLGMGSYVTLIGKSGDWWYVRHSGGTGYCNDDYITVLNDDTARVTVTWGTLNVRRGAGTEHTVKANLQNGTVVSPLWSHNGWTRILYYGSEVGWVKSEYLSSGNAYYGGGAVSLSVPHYSQLDGRWRYRTLGSSKSTVGQEGCALTSIAMLQSYRYGYAVTPADLLGQLRFTSGGALYLPSDYNNYYNSDYLAKIKSLLNSGKPVIVAAKKYSGAQHWVVVTGCTGGNGAGSFAINDPGSTSRATLADLFADYPVFYKAVYYN